MVAKQRAGAVRGLAERRVPSLGWCVTSTAARVRAAKGSSVSKALRGLFSARK
jgi:hypothetical protein